jgi:hypothetical protein
VTIRTHLTSGCFAILFFFPRGSRAKHKEKFQMPNPKSQINSKIQFPMSKTGQTPTNAEGVEHLYEKQC